MLCENTRRIEFLTAPFPLLNGAWPGMRRLDRAGELLTIGLEMEIPRNVLLTRLEMDDPISGDRLIDRRRARLLTKENARERQRATQHREKFILTHDGYLCFDYAATSTREKLQRQPLRTGQTRDFGQTDF